MIQIAITGGIACGKSLVGAYLAEQGWRVCEADLVAHELYTPGGAAYHAVCDLVGTDIVQVDGSIDRKKLARIVFEDQALLRALNEILHPLVRDEISKWLEMCLHAGGLGAAVIIPLLYESGMEKGWDAVVCIGCSPAVQRQRLLSRGLGEAEIDARIAAQWPMEKKMALADYPIWNDGDRETLSAAIQDVIERVSERK